MDCEAMILCVINSERYFRKYLRGGYLYPFILGNILSILHISLIRLGRIINDFAHCPFVCKQ